jgi:5-methylcytosine-specific restriction endonuclease McrA
MRLCSGAGCGRAVPEDVRFCDECKPPSPSIEDGIRDNQRTDGYNDELDALRKGTRWQKVRERVIKQQPFCVRCSVRLSEIVDHIVPAQVAVAQVRDSGRFPYDKCAGYYLMSNLQGLCRPCHHTKTVEDKTHVGPWPDVLDVEALKGKKKWTF